MTTPVAALPVALSASDTLYRATDPPARNSHPLPHQKHACTTSPRTPPQPPRPPRPSRPPHRRLTHRLKLLFSTTDPLHFHAFRHLHTAASTPHRPAHTNPLNLALQSDLFAFSHLPLKSLSRHHQSPFSFSPLTPHLAPLHHL